MSELPERLRELAEALQCCEWEVPLCAAEDCEKAADELERLADLKRTCQCSEDEQCMFARERDAAKAEIEQLQHQLAEDYLASKAESERLTAIINDRNCAIHELQDVMEWQRDKLAECRRLLREAVEHKVWTTRGKLEPVMSERWRTEAAKAAGGDDE